ncbi:BAG family molecular chaperone regulator 6 [Glycine soja]
MNYQNCQGEVIQFKIESAIGKGDEPILLELRLEQLATIINKYSSNQCPRLLKITPLVATLKKSSHDGLLEFQALLHSQLTKVVMYDRVCTFQGRVQAFERSPELQNDDKQKIAIGETIMRLLLKLDTILGLHPSFREIRKSLARELIILKERLNSIIAKKPQQQMPDADV